MARTLSQTPDDGGGVDRNPVDERPLAGPLLIKLRTVTGRSQAQQAELLSQLSGRPVTRHEVSRWESEHRLPTPHWQRHISDSFNIEIAQITSAVTNSRVERRRSRAANGADKNHGTPFSRNDNPGPLVTQGSTEIADSQPLGRADVEVIREMITTFRRLDNRFGGGHGRAALQKYLSSTVDNALQEGRIQDAWRHDLFVASAELYQVAGWMAYDMADRATGRRYLQTALRLSQEVTSESLTAEILAGMSHQASFKGSADSAVELALAAGHSARRAGLRKVQAEAAAMEAHGLGLQGDRRACVLALSRAEKYFQSTNDRDAPEWLSYFDEAYLAAKFGHALRHLKQSSEAERFARRSLEMCDGYDRGRVFNTALLAGILADQAKIDEAAFYAIDAVDMSEGMRSVRTKHYLLSVYRQLAAHKNVTPVAEFEQKLALAGHLIC